MSVDSDPRFLALVQKQIDALAPATRPQHRLIHANIGLTQEWGRPIFRRPEPRRLRRWRTYVEAPWAALRELHATPDTVLVDGRFRVACALETVRNLGADSPCRILFDDYQRDFYHPIEAFAELVEMQGRMGVFRTQPNDADALARALDEFCRDWR